MSVDLKELLFLAGHDKDDEALGKIIEQFKPIIGKYTRWLDYDGAETDLIISLIEKIRSINFSNNKFINDGQVVNYIANSIKNKSIDIHRKHKRMLEEIYVVSLYDIKDEIPCRTDEFCELIECLQGKQKAVICMRYYYGLSDVEIGVKLGISRQAVNKIHRKALNILRGEVGGEKSGY